MVTCDDRGTIRGSFMDDWEEIEYDKTAHALYQLRMLDRQDIMNERIIKSRGKINWRKELIGE